MKNKECWINLYSKKKVRRRLFEEDPMMKELNYYTGGKKDVAQSKKSQLDVLVAEENVARSKKSENIISDDENQETCELDLSPKKKESGYCEDNQEKIDNIIENCVKQYGSQILSIGCSVSTESNELIIDEEADLLDDENDEQDFASSCSCSTVTVDESLDENFNDEYSENIVFFADDLDIMRTIEIGEPPEDDLVQIQHEQRHPLSDISEEMCINQDTYLCSEKVNIVWRKDEIEEEEIEEIS